MDSPLLKYLLSFENKSNTRYAPTFPLYKFHRLYEEKRDLSDEDRRASLSIEKEDKTGFYILNPFLLSLLQNHSIWFAASSQFNDPWDAGRAVSILRKDVAIEESVLKLLFGEDQRAEITLLPDHAKYESIEDRLREEFGVLRFACFSKQYDSHLMWAHYADSHKGICLQFRFMRPLPKSSSIAFRMDAGFPGHYSVRYTDGSTSIDNINDIGSAVEVLHTKHQSWAYEDEVRFIAAGDPDHPDAGRAISFDRSSLTNVILGCKVPKRVWRMIDFTLTNLKYPHTGLVVAENDPRTQRLRYSQLSREKPPDRQIDEQT